MGGRGEIASPDTSCNRDDRESGAGRFGASLCISNANEMPPALHYFRLVIIVNLFSQLTWVTDCLCSLAYRHDLA
jgi:hypothetical protein